MSEFSPFWAETRNMELATTKSWIKTRGHCLSFHPAHLPALRPRARFGGQSPAVRVALRPEMCGQFQRSPELAEMGSKMAEKRKPAVVIPQSLRPQEKTRGQPEERRPL